MPWMGLVAITGRIERRVSRGDETNCRCKENHPSCHWRIFQGAHPSDYTTILLTAALACNIISVASNSSTQIDSTFSVSYVLYYAS